MMTSLRHVWMFVAITIGVMVIYQNCSSNATGGSGSSGSAPSLASSINPSNNTVTTGSGTTSGNSAAVGNNGPGNCSLTASVASADAGDSAGLWWLSLTADFNIPSSAVIMWEGTDEGQNITPVGPQSADVTSYQWEINFLKGQHTRFLILSDPNTQQVLCTSNSVSIDIN